MVRFFFLRCAQTLLTYPDQPEDAYGVVRSGVCHLGQLSLPPQSQEYVQGRNHREFSTGSTVPYPSEELDELFGKAIRDRAGGSIVPTEQTCKAATEETLNRTGGSTGKRKRNFREVGEPARRPRPREGSLGLPVNDRRLRRKDEEFQKGIRGKG